MFVIIGELLQHREARFLFARGGFAGQFDHFAFVMVAIDVGAFERQIDEARHRILFPNGNLAQQQRLLARVLQHRQQRAQRPARLVDLVDEQEMRNRKIAQPFQIGLQHLHLSGIRLAHDNRRIDAGQHVQGVLEKFDGAGTIETGEALVEIFDRRAIHLDTHLPGARFRREIADRVALCDGAFALRGAGDGKNAFQQRRLSAAVWTHEGHCTWPASSILSWHKRLHHPGTRGVEARRAQPYRAFASRAPLEEMLAPLGL